MKRKMMKKIAILSLMSAIPLAVYGGVQSLNASAEPTTVYVSATGRDYNKGTRLSPYKTLDRAVEKVSDGGTIIVLDTLAIDSWTAHNKTFTLSGGSLDATALSSLQIKDNVTFTDIQLLVNANEYICANGYTVKMDEGVTLSNIVDIYGGGSSTTVAGTNLTLLSGSYRSVYGGGLYGKVNGDVHLTVGGTVNAGIENVFRHDQDGSTFYMYGGGYCDTITGNVYFNFEDDAKANYMYGASNIHGSTSGSATISGSTNLTITGGEAMSIYGSGRGVNTGSDANTVITGGTFEQVFGACERASLTGDVDLRVLGGTIKRRIYGGCYNDTEDLSFATSYSVNGNIDLALGSGASITYKGENDNSVYAHSRHSTNFATESARLIFTDETIYNNYKKGSLTLKTQDRFGMNLIIGSLSVADETHYYTYSVEENVITQTCEYHKELAATATLSGTQSVEYTGNAITPVEVAYGADWEYDEFALVYENNVEEGEASCYVRVPHSQVNVYTKTFAIRKAPKVLGGSVRTINPSGLRFQSKVAVSFVNAGAKFGTLIIPKEVLGDTELSHENPLYAQKLIEDVPQKKWATEDVKANKTQIYEEGYAYFNAVLKGIPEDYYDTVIAARSYAYLDGVYYYSETVERSIAQVAASALQDNNTEDILYDYVDKAFSEEKPSMANVQVEEGLTYQLEIVGGKGYAAIWSCLNEDIVTVDENGCITALKEGTAKVTAQIGKTKLTCWVTVVQGWADGY